MSRRYLSIGIAVSSTLIIALLILFGPGLEKKTKDTLVLDTAWKEIEYDPGNAAEAAAEKAKQESQSTGAADKKSKKDTKPTEDFLPKKFIRNAGFLSEDYFVEIPVKESSSPAVRRRGNYSVRNIFSDWSKLRYTASYQVPDTELAKYGPFIEKIRLKNSSGTITASLGRKMSNGNQFLTVDDPAQKGIIYLIAGHLSDRFRMSPMSFREKRILTYPTDSYTARIEVTRKNASPPTVWFRAEKFTKDNQQLFKWFDMKEREIPVNVATPLDNFVKLIEISRFRDEPEVSAFGDAEKLWDAAADSEVVIKVQVKKGADYTLQLRRPKEPLNADKRTYALLRSNVETGTDFVDAATMTNIEQQLMLLASYQPLPQNTQIQNPNPAAGPNPNTHPNASPLHKTQP